MSENRIAGAAVDSVQVPSSALHGSKLDGLTSDAARKRLRRFGRNEIRRGIPPRSRS